MLDSARFFRSDSDSTAGWCTEHYTADGPRFRPHTIPPNPVVEHYQCMAGEVCNFLSNVTFPNIRRKMNDIYSPKANVLILLNLPTHELVVPTPYYFQLPTRYFHNPMVVDAIGEDDPCNHNSVDVMRGK